MSDNKQQSKQGSFSWFSLAMAFIFLACTAQAESIQNIKPYTNVIEIVSDAELSGMRGRFIRQGRPIYFGISMQSQWITADGQIINAGMNIGFNLNKDFSDGDMVTIDALLDDTGQASAEIPSSTVTVGGLDSTRGVAQAITVAGDDNQAHNKTYMTLHFNTQQNAASGISGDKVFFFGGESLGTSQTSTTSLVGKNGTVTTAFVDETGVGVRIAVPNQGVAMQLLRGKSGSREGSGFFQTVEIAGDANQVFNRLDYFAEFAPLNGTTGSAIRPALESLKAIQGLGIQ